MSRHLFFFFLFSAHYVLFIALSAHKHVRARDLPPNEWPRSAATRFNEKESAESLFPGRAARHA